MKHEPVTYQFSELDSGTAIQQLATVLQSPLQGDVITIDPSMGSGTIRKMHIEDGLILRGWDFCLRQPFILEKVNEHQPAEKFFHLIYVLNPEAVTLTLRSSNISFRLQKGMNVLFASGDISFEAEIDCNENLKALDVSFTAGWLQRSFYDSAEELKNFIQTLITSTSPTIFFESTSISDYQVLCKAHATITSGLRDNLKIKSGVLTLLACFFNSVPRKLPGENISNNFVYYDQVMQVEKILEAHVEKKLPCIPSIAKSIGMSESSLKRHFKNLFGHSIYEHYLQLKMEHAKNILLEKRSSVNEVASLLEYEKVSSFIGMFKRHHGVSPGAMLQRMY